MSRAKPKLPGARATLKDVAAHAAVSIATVSYVLNRKHPERVSPTTRARVLHAARQLRYSPNSTARSLVTRRTATITAYIPRPLEFALRDSAISLLLAGIIQKCTLADYAVQIAIEGHNLDRFHTDGWLCIQPRTPIPTLEHQATPLVYIDPEFATATPTLSTGNAEAATLLGQYLCRHSRHMALALSHPPEHLPQHIRHRCEALSQSLAGKATLTLVAPDRPSHDPQQNAAILAPRLLDTPTCDTLVAQNDELGALLMKHALERGLRIPEDMQFAAFDETGLARLCHPTLTTVRLHTQELGYRAAHLLLSQLSAPQSETLPLHAPPPPTLHPGHSTRP